MLCNITNREEHMSVQHRKVRMGDLRASMTEAAGGVRYISCDQPLGDYPRAMTDRLQHWAETTPEQVFLAERQGDGWRTVTYAQAWQTVQSLAQMLLGHNLSESRPLLILSGNDIEHALLGYAAMLIGVPYAPISPAYSLISKDFAKVRHIDDLLDPGLVYASDGAAYAPAILAAISADVPVLVQSGDIPGRRIVSMADALATEPTEQVERARAHTTPDTIAKFLFTSGSTGMPKAVTTTNRMLCANQEMIRSALAFLGDEPPVLIDWMPWNHTAGGNHNLGIALYNGGLFYIDDGKPTPDGVAATVRNLKTVSPTVYFSVPKGYEMLHQHLVQDEELRDAFFRRLKLMQYAGAGLAQHVWDGLDATAISATGERIMIISGYGSTETAPFALTTTWPVERAGEIGLPAPGLELKLVPNGQKLEVRLRGPNVTPGYWRQPDKTGEAFDEEGFYCIGDALKFVDPDDISRGLAFDGRVTEDFKLSTGTWVNMAAVRTGLVAACAPLVRDVVLTGLDRNHIGAMIFLDMGGCAEVVGQKLPPDVLVDHPSIRRHLSQALDALAAKATGSSNHVARTVLLAEPPSIDGSEITDKGSINQRAVMARRAALVEELYAEPVPDHVFVSSRKAKS
ncbi:MAG: feruloyl-CoA synthase [Devosia sp.]|uniref:feruloyl-CoA synthase n=1 Tax=Devosia sp. TaxID=1871048 RepID=UPI0033994782